MWGTVGHRRSEACALWGMKPCPTAKDDHHRRSETVFTVPHMWGTAVWGTVGQECGAGCPNDDERPAGQAGGPFA